MSSGLQKFLEKISQDPSNKVLIKRYITLVREIRSDQEKIQHILQLSELLSEVDPADAMTYAFMVFQYENTSIPALETIAKCLKNLGRYGKAEVIKNEIEKLKMSTASGMGGRNEASFATNAASIQIGGKELVSAMDFTPNLERASSVDESQTNGNGMITELMPRYPEDRRGEYSNTPTKIVEEVREEPVAEPSIQDEEESRAPRQQKPEKLPMKLPELRLSEPSTEELNRPEETKEEEISKENTGFYYKPNVLDGPSESSLTAENSLHDGHDIVDRAFAAEEEDDEEGEDRTPFATVKDSDTNSDFVPNFATEAEEPIEPPLLKSIEFRPPKPMVPQPAKARFFSAPIKVPAKKPPIVIPELDEEDPEPGEFALPDMDTRADAIVQEAEEIDHGVIVEMFDFYWRQGLIKEARDLMAQCEGEASHLAWWKARKNIIEKAAHTFQANTEKTRVNSQEPSAKKSEAQKWGDSLDELIRENRPRKALNQIEAKIHPGVDLEWAIVAWERLVVVWPKLGMRGFEWRSGQGVVKLSEKLQKRQLVKLSTVVGKKQKQKAG